MNLRNLYYGIKPWMPYPLQLSLRRAWVRRRLPGVADRWPVDTRAGRRPEGWTGWPEGRQFALVLTHDVETSEGRDKCLAVAALEEELGFRSSFNFIPMKYENPDTLREELTGRGFEIGVHGLIHDGKLFRSRRIWRERAAQINEVVRAWGAVGFRAPSMHHQLAWIRDLEIEYDASTFDTDPFEPQPDGFGTVFPFLVPRGDRSGIAYVELPYTLPQDSTLYLCMRETGPELWLRKLDWIAEQGGMALVITHPDYMQLEGESDKEKYPIRIYREFLEKAAERYGTCAWHALPRDAARHARTGGGAPVAAIGPHGRRESVGMVVFSQYPQDPRVRRAAEALVAGGYDVNVICLKDEESPGSEDVRGVTVHRLPVTRKRATRGRYVVEYSLFLAAAALKLSELHWRRRFGVVHVHNMPDVLVFSALLPKIFGAKVILDLHDPTPEVFMAKYGTGKSNRTIRLIRALERLSLRFADMGITPNIAFRELFLKRGCPPEKMQIVMNSPEERIFASNGAHPPKVVPYASFRLMYHGSISARQGTDVALRALHAIREEAQPIRLDIFGSGDDFVDVVLRLIDELELNDLVTYHGSQPQEEIAEHIRTIDLGLIPNRRNAFTELNFPTRIFEYLAMGKPVIVPRTKGILDYFDDDNMIFFEPDDAESLAGAILRVYGNPERAAVTCERGRGVYAQHTWQQQRARYLQIVADLFE